MVVVQAEASVNAAAIRLTTRKRRCGGGSRSWGTLALDSRQDRDCRDAPV